jgi:hypothetical protein
VSCHDYDKEPGRKLNLARDRDLVFNTSYIELWRNQWIRTVGAGPSDTQAAYSWGSHASRLVQTLLNNPRCGGGLTKEDFDRIVTWIDLNAPYYPTYASAYPDNLAGRSPLTDAQLERLEKITGVPLRQLAAHSSNRGPQVSFDRPELSLCLRTSGNLSEPQRLEALEIIRSGQNLLAQRPEADTPGFQASSMDQWRNEKYLARQQRELSNRKAIETGNKAYERIPQ